MPSITVTAPNGKSLTIQGDHVPNEAELHDIFAKAGVDTGATAPPPAADGPPALSRFGSQLYDKSPLATGVAAAGGVGNAVMHPLDTYFGLKPAADTVVNLAKAQWDQAVQAAQKAKEAAAGTGGGGSIGGISIPAPVLSASEAFGHGLAAVLPILGPAAADAGEHGARGDVAGMIGGALGLLMPFAAKAGLDLRAAPNPAKADVLERQATSQVAERVLAPGNPKYKPTAAKVAPEVLSRGLSTDIGRFGDARAELQQMSENGKADALHRIEAVWNQNPTQPITAQPIVDGLNAEIAKSYVDGKIVPGEEPRLRALTAQRDFVASHGPTLTAADMRQLRQVLDRQASEAGLYAKNGDATYGPVEAAAKKAADLAREQLAAHRPDAAAPNADYTFWARLGDVLDPTKGRPKQTNFVPTGVTGGMSTTGALVGQTMRDLPVVGPLIGSELLPRLKALVNSPAWELAAAQKKLALADAMRAGHVGNAKRLMIEITELAPRGVPGWAAQPATAQTTQRNSQ